MACSYRQRMRWRSALLYTCLSVPLIVILCIAYVHYEHPAYVWDLGAYWHFFKLYGGMIARHDPSWFTSVLASIRGDDYNPSAIIPLLPFYFLFGGGRSVYICAIATMCLLPAVVLVSAMAFKSRGSEGDRLPYWIVFVLAVTFVPFWFPTLRGYVDIIGLISLCMATLILYETDFLRRAAIRSAVFIGCLLWTAFLFRRWYAFSAIGFLVASFMAGIFGRWCDGRGSFWRGSVLLAISLAFSGIVAAGFVAAFQSTLATRILTTSYADSFSAYQIPLGVHLKMLVDRLSIFGVAIASIGAAVALHRRNERLLFCLIAAATTFVLFIRTQAFGSQHFLPVAMWGFPLLVAGLDQLYGWIPARAKWCAKTLAGIVPVIVFAIDVSPALPRGGVVASLFVPSPPVYPLHLLRYEEYQRLLADLVNYVGEHHTVVIYASSFILSDSLLEALSPELQPHVIDQVQVDRTASFDFSVLRADYAVAASPPQTHLPIDFQRAITLPGDLLLRREGVGAAFEPMGEPYRLPEVGIGAAFEPKEEPYRLPEVATTIFRRTRLVTLAEMGDLLRRFAVYHPDWPRAYQKSLAIPFAAREIIAKDNWGHGAVANPNTIVLHPDGDLPSSVTIPLDPSLGAIPYRLILHKDPLPKACALADGADVTVLADDSLVWHGTVKGGDSFSIDLPKTEKRLKLLIDKRANNLCDQVLAEFEIPGE
jgi:hypothetical protein